MRTRVVCGIAALGALVISGRAIAATRTWDGGGATGNWSEAANWLDDVLPVPGDVAVFDGTSSKDATLDVAINLQGLRIDAGYTGTLTQTAGADLFVGNGLSGSIYDQAGGAFIGGAAAVAFRFTTFTLTGGVFNLGASDASFSSSDLRLTGGRFIAASGTMRLSGTYTRSNPATFEHNSGTVILTGSTSLEIDGPGSGTEVLNNLTVDNPDSFNSSIGATDTVRVSGSLDLIDGDVNSGTLEAQGPVAVDSRFGFSSGGGSATLLITGQPRTITLPTGMGPFLNLDLDAPGTIVNTSGPGPITLKRVTLRQGTIDSGQAEFQIGTGTSFVEYTQSGGTFHAGGGSLTLPFVNFTLTGGVFDLGASEASFSGNTNLTGGRFIASSGTMGLSGTYTRSNPATFEHNNGTVILTGSTSLEIDGPGSGTEVLNNLTVDNPDSFNSSIGATDTVRVSGSLDLIDGDVNSGTLEAQGPVAVDSRFGFSSGGGSATLLITGQPRTITLPTGMGPFLNLDLNAPGTTIETDGPGPITLKRVTLRQGTIDTGQAAFQIGTGTSFVEYTQSGGTFHAGGGSLTLPFVNFTLTGGVFDLGASNTTFSGGPLTLTSGRFIASSGTMLLSGNYQRSDPATFEHNNGTVIVNGSFSSEINGPGTGVDAFNHLTLDSPNDSSIGAADTARVVGELSLVNGRLFSGRLQAEGPVSVAATFDGGSAAFAFGGAVDQSYVNAGGPNLTGVWTVDKPAGTVTLASDLNLGNGTTDFVLTNGTITTGVRVVDVGTRAVTRTSGHVVGDLRRTLTSTGAKVFDVGTTDGYSPISVDVTTLTVDPSILTVGARPGAHPILDPSRSLSRFWSLTETGDLTATLLFDYLQADVSGTEGDYKVARIFGGEVSFLDPPLATIDVTSNRATVPDVSDFSDWSLGERPAPPPPLAIDPPAASVPAGESRSFVATGGVLPYAFSLPENNSGGSIDAASGLYTAGTLAAVTDTVRVTDALGAEANATVSVVAGTATRLAFLNQPSLVVAGRAIPSVRIHVQDQFGNVVTSATGDVSIAIASNPGGATLTGTLSVTPGVGIANFFDLSLDRAATGYSLIATSGALTSATSETFDVIPDIPTQLAFIVQPSNVAVGLPITPPVEVAIQDRFGNLTNATNLITIGGLNLSGEPSQFAVGGVAVFDDLIVDFLGTGFRLSATSSGGLTGGPSAPFDVVTRDLVVTNTNDAGPGSLRQAILDANALPGRETIRFDIGDGGMQTIKPLTVLPPITSPVVIDGATQPGYSGTPLIELDGVNFQPGPSGIDGLDVAGGDSVIKALAINGFTGPDADGIVLRSSQNEVQGCFLGVGVDGFTARGNQFGLRVLGDDNVIGGPAAIDRNVISGNLEQGVLILSRRNEVVGNFIGTGADGSAVSNGADGILMISPNSVGDFSPGRGNRIAFNGGAGILLAEALGEVRGNSIHSNQGLGIDFGGDGVTANDPGDANPQNFPVLHAVLGAPGGIIIQGTLDSRISVPYTLDFYASSSCDPSGHGEGETPIGSMTVTTDGTGRAEFSANLPTALAAGTVVTATAIDLLRNATSEFSRCLGLGEAILAINPTAASVDAGAVQAFVATGGVPPHVFSLPVNNSGGSIDPASGLYTAGPLAGVTDIVRLTDAFGTEVNASVNVVVGPAIRLVFRVQPTNTVAGLPIRPQVEVAVQDRVGNLVISATNIVSIALANNPGGDTLAGATIAEARVGIATFGDLSLDRAASGYSLIATSGALTPATSEAFDVAPDVAARLAFTVQPSSVTLSLPIAPAVEVAVQDRFGNRTSATNAVNLMLLGVSGGVLAGTLPRNAADGIAVFDDLTIDRPGAGYSLRATSGALTAANSAPFDVLARELVVTNTDDAGPGSLRQAILEANALAGKEIIRFDIPGGGPHLIKPLTLLPKITSPVVIDGSTEPGYSGTPLIELDGINVTERRSTGTDGLDVGGSDSVIRALAITRFTGNDSDGIVLRSSRNRLQGCYVGVGLDGATARGNTFGLRVLGNDNLVGGSEVIDRNVISGNIAQGVIFLSSRFTVVIGNFIGTSADGSAAVPNGADGILMSQDTVVGDFSPGSGNLIAFNGGAGISTLFRVSQTRVRGNSIHSNQGLGIDVDGDGVTPNDPGDGGSGSNPQNFPILNAVLGIPGAVTIQGTLDSKPSATFTLDFYASSSCDPSGHGEGETPLGSKTVTTDDSGLADFTATLPMPLAAGTVVTATATDSQQNTSEFSPCQRLGDATFFVTNTSDEGPGSLRQAIEDVTTASGVKAIHFNIPGSGPFTIAPDVALPAIVGPVVIDGTTQPGFAGTPLIEIDASNSLGECEAVLEVGGSNNTIKGLTFRGCLGPTGIPPSAGILLEGTGGHTIQACHVVGNEVGILVTSSNNRIGGSIPFERNVISGNSGAGISLRGSANVVEGNFIGTNASGTASGGLQMVGVSSEGKGHRIGGSSPNIIAFNSSSGVRVSSGSVAVRGNSIFANSGLGIDLLPDGVTPNDNGDDDLGPNELQNFPILTGVNSTGGATTIQGRLASKPSTTYTLDFYGNAGCNPSGNGEGQTRLGSSAVTTNAGGIVDFLADLPAALTGVTFVTATATDPQGNTSEFSPCRLFASVLTVENANDTGPGSLRQALLDANASTGPDLIRFNFTGSGAFVIAPRTPFPAISGSVVIDGTTQPGYAGTPRIQIRGSILSPGTNCLVLDGGNSTVKGLAINRCGLGTGAGLRLQGSGGHTVQACSIGTLPGTGAASPNLEGIVVSSSNNLIGGPAPTDGNVISGNVATGISILATSSPASGNVVQGNRIGTDSTGSIAVPNGVGVRISASGNVVGGEVGNVIAHNTGGGVIVSAGTGNLLRGNDIHSNGGLPIDLGDNGLTANDAEDLDSGANNLQNFPALTSAITDGTNTIVEGTLNSRPASSHGIDFYGNESCDPSGHGGGQFFLGSATVALGGSGISGFTAVLPGGGVSAGQFVTATATDVSGNTSELSSCVPVSAQGRIEGHVLHSDGGRMNGVEVRLSGAQQESVLTNTAGFFEFGNLPRGDYVVTPVRPNFAFEPPFMFFTNLDTTRDVDFVGTERFRIAGRATSLFEGTIYALGGVSVTLSGGVSRTAVTDGSGLYAFDNVPQAASFTVAAAKPGFVFTPASVAIVGPLEDDQVADFQGGLASPLPGRIALAGAGKRIHVMNADGSGLVPVTEAGKVGAGDFDPRYSRDGRKLAFRRVRVSPLGGQLQLLNLGEIHVMTADGSDLLRVTDNSAAEFTDAGPAWSPDGRRIAFVRAPARTPGTNEDLIVMNANGSGPMSVLRGVPPALRAVGAADWSPDGTRIAFSMSHERSNGRQIFLVDPDGANLIALTAGSPDSFNPAWSPDGKRIAFSRKVGSGANPFAVFVMNADGRGVSRVASLALGDRLAWSPDGKKLAYVRRAASTAVGNELVVVNPDGIGPLVVATGPIAGPTWSGTVRTQTPSGTDVEVREGAAAITFGGVTAAGQTTVIPIPADAVGGPPNGFVLGNIAFEISTSAEFTPPLTICITVGPMSAAQFDSLALLHVEEGALVDRTTSRDLDSRTVCGVVDSLSPFALAEAIAPGAPTITGLVSDGEGKPLGGVTVALTGTETRNGATSLDGLFTFANLEEGGNYSVEPEQLGFLFDEPQQDFVDLHGDQTVVFRATPATFRISGRVLSAPGDRGMGGISVTLEGSELRQATTDLRGRYSFEDVPAGGTYTVTPSRVGLMFAPGQEVLVDLTGDETDVDFVLEGSAEQEAVQPILECVADNGDGSFTAHFGYLNEGGASVTIAIGRDNKFKPAPSDRGQPTVFQPGRVENAFSAVFRGRRLVWVLRGPDGRRHTVVALRDGPSCP